MSELWWWILAGCAAAYGIKLLGYLVPEKILENERATRAAGALTIGLLASLTIVNTVASGSSVEFDARLAALAAAAVALLLRAPFLVVVIAGAGAAALVRYLGWA
ncbi:AzlD domain-containing protein [Paeniglutamicibacter sp. ABSL32-1]|uniref:AzlD domain-containing protein n=1 Tax=Paeniglutamicibacter quisquiliarum TaxID=2849498 RepID=UPI001C2DC3DE|nr:AzlD domain-containing protein [Paeniglutamicibacter quisquiliarum]MBV1779462.1 AzlD domain-containing protein [Paeniglutamicibacter quisquiliarum]